MAPMPDGLNVAVRDSKHPDGDILVVDRSTFGAWLSGAKGGEFDHLLEA
jgi:Domain of unknown function (DUF397)